MTGHASIEDETSGSPQTGEPLFLAVGKLRRPHGLRGELLMEVWTDFPERLQPGVVLYVGPQHHPLRLRSQRAHKHGLLVAFEGIADPEHAGKLRNQLATVQANDRPPLPDGEFYHHQLLGLRVVDEGGAYLGELCEILETGANDVYILRPPSGPEILLPATDEVIVEIALESSEMRVRIPDGLLSAEEDERI